MLPRNCNAQGRYYWAPDDRRAERAQLRGQEGRGGGREAHRAGGQTEVWPVAADVVETAYKLAGKGSEYKVEDIQFLSSDQFGYSSNYMGLLMREKPGANIMIGAYWAESMQLAETGSRVGAMQISGTAQTSQIPFFLVATDYCLIGEEIFSAGAYLSQEPQLIASLAGQDVGRIIATIIVVLGGLLTTVGSKLILDIMAW